MRLWLERHQHSTCVIFCPGRLNMHVYLPGQISILPGQINTGSNFVLHVLDTLPYSRKSYFVIICQN